MSLTCFHFTDTILYCVLSALPTGACPGFSVSFRKFPENLFLGLTGVGCVSNFIRKEGAI